MRRHPCRAGHDEDASRDDRARRDLCMLRSAGLLVTCKQGRVVDNRLADKLPAPLRDDCLRQLDDCLRQLDDCLRQLIALTHTTDE